VTRILISAPRFSDAAGANACVELVVLSGGLLIDSNEPTPNRLTSIKTSTRYVPATAGTGNVQDEGTGRLFA
jgi:hypothetical protein